MEEMNEVNDFMSRFNQDVETKWGLATDSSLGGKVKITLLATGFGLQNVPGVEDLKKEKDIARSIEDAEEKDKLEARILTYYDPTSKSVRRRHHNVFIFSDDDLDDENVIAMVDTLPAYKRTLEDLKRIKQQLRQQ